jgi:prepilin-type N-terminal cleavage/methylation domain-containing protein
MQSKRNATGFTLIELLVVIAIISLLVSILLPSLTKAKELARQAVCQTNLHNMGIGLNMYASDGDGKYPERDGRLPRTGQYWYFLLYMCRHWEDYDEEICPEGTGLISDYIGDVRVMYCPGRPLDTWRTSNRLDGSGRESTCSYEVLSYSSFGPSTIGGTTLRKYVARDGTSDPATMIAQDMVCNSGGGLWNRSNHPSDTYADDESCIGGNVLYNDTSVNWKPLDEYDQVYYTVGTHPEGLYLYSTSY